VLSGGGARGAYEAGALSWILGELPKRLGRPVHLDIVTGSSVGAVAGECVRHRGRSHGLREWLGRSLMRYGGAGVLEEADLLSYLLFDRCFADHPIELGRSDAAAAGDAIAAFVDGPRA
jgi:predicted acylesterase/phospholipase RssA